jgi:hypothetical protein
MRVAEFTITERADGTLIGENAAFGLAVCAMDRESLQEEARDALIRAVGPAHISYRIKLQNPAGPGPRLTAGVVASAISHR